MKTKIIRKDVNNNIDLTGFKEPVVVGMGNVTKVFKGRTIRVFFTKKEQTKKPYIIINKQLYEVI